MCSSVPAFEPFNEVEFLSDFEIVPDSFYQRYTLDRFGNDIIDASTHQKSPGWILGIDYTTTHHALVAIVFL